MITCSCTGYFEFKCLVTGDTYLAVDRSRRHSAWSMGFSSEMLGPVPLSDATFCDLSYTWYRVIVVVSAPLDWFIGMVYCRCVPRMTFKFLTILRAILFFQSVAECSFPISNLSRDCWLFVANVHMLHLFTILSLLSRSVGTLSIEYFNNPSCDADC